MRLIDQPLSPKEVATFEAGRDLGAELLQAVQEMKAGMVQVAYNPVTALQNADDRAPASDGDAGKG